MTEKDIEPDTEATYSRENAPIDAAEDTAGLEGTTPPQDGQIQDSMVSQPDEQHQEGMTAQPGEQALEDTALSQDEQNQDSMVSQPDEQTLEDTAPSQDGQIQDNMVSQPDEQTMEDTAPQPEEQTLEGTVTPQDEQNQEGMAPSQDEPSLEDTATPQDGQAQEDKVPTDGDSGNREGDIRDTPEDAESSPGDEAPVSISIVQPEEPSQDMLVTEKHTLGVTDIRKRFGRKEVVRGVGFTMCNGEVAGLLGPNGAGKTTIFYMIVGFYKPNAGYVHMNGTNITAKPMFRRARMGIAYLPQEPSIFRKLTVEQNIQAILESRRDINRATKKERLEQLLEEFGIGRVRKQLGYTLSGGERRRTEIARALASEPKFLLLDEPFAGIDPIAVFEIKQIIRRLAEKGIGILITDHNVRDTLEITTEAFIIADGSIVARGDREAILANEMVREVYLGSEFRM